jgi:hypothetical protein
VRKILRAYGIAHSPVSPWLKLLRMKNALFASLLFLASCASSPEADKSSTPDTARYAVAMPSKAPGAVFKTPVIELDTTKSVHFADFGTHTTETSFGIRDTLGNAITGKDFPENERALVDISMLKPGRYEVYFTAIAEGCTFSLFVR